jgi:peroxiredoxin
MCYFFSENQWRRVVIGLFILLSISLVGCTRSTVTTKDSNGNVINFADYRGKWIVLNYWASWCKPCKTEIPELNAFYSGHKDLDAVVLGVNYDQVDITQLQQLVKQFVINYPVLSTDPGPALGITSVPGIPASFLINPEGKLVKTLYGEQTQIELEKAMGLPAGKV